MQIKKFFAKFLPLFILAGIAATGCEVGLGEEVDLEAPELVILSPEKLSYQRLSFDLSGTCKDNIGITDVTISNKETGKIYGQAEITGENWFFHIDLEKEEEGEVTFLVTANDAFKNSSTKSARTITLLVDEHAPEGLSWYVDRGNSIQTPLKEKEFLQNLDLNLAVNKDYPQNQKFTLNGNFYDAMSIDEITVKLWDDDYNPAAPVLTKTVRSNSTKENYIGDGKSIYSPAFEFKNEDFPSALRTGKHYLRVTYYAQDNDTIQKNSADVDTGLYIFWYPESDKPGIQQTQIEDGILSASVGSSIPIDFFDDDGLKTIKYALKNTSYTTAQVISGASTLFTDSDSEPAGSNTFTNNTTRDKPVQLDAPNIPGQMWLITYAEDIGGQKNARVIQTEITDANKPLLFIESPSENTIPDMKSGSTEVFQIKGYSLDSKGSKYIAILYCPDESGSQDEIQRLVTSNFSSKINNSTKGESGNVTLSGGKKLWYQEFSTGTQSNGWNKQAFEIDMNTMQDFKDASGRSTAKDRKYFDILLVDTDNNVIYKPFIVNGDSTQPSVEIVYPDKELTVHDYTQNDLTIKFKGVKSTGLGMQNDSYKITTKIRDKLLTFNKISNPSITVDSNGYASVTIPKATLKTWFDTEPQPTFTFYATDLLGNGGNGEGQRSIILSPRPTISEITVDKNNGVYKKGDVLKFKVSFNKQVKVTGTPSLKLKYSSSDSSPKFATYSGGSGSNSLTFTFTVPEDAISSGIICDGFQITSENVFPNGIAIKATELGEADVYTKLPDGKVLAGKEIKLDGKAPAITKVTVQGPDGITDCTKDKQITAIVEMSENILVSGSPVLNLYVGTTKVPFTFQKMNGKEITFVHTVTTSDPEGILTYNLINVFSSTDAAYITDEPGNTLKTASVGSATNTPIKIDYTAPSNAPTTNLTADTYNAAQTITLGNIETGATAYYSKDGGVSWTEYKDSAKEEIGNGTYKIVTRQADKAGNMSRNSSVKTVTINNLFAPVTGFNIDLGDGQYKENTEFTFTLNFDEEVVVNNTTDITLTFASIKDTTKTKTINVVKPAVANSTSVTFKYKVTNTDFFEGIQVKEIAFASGFKDAFGNSPAFSGTASKLTPTNCTFLAATDGGKRSGIILDGILPSISAAVPAMNGTSINGSSSGISAVTDNSKFKITLTFSENVYKEVGNIILQRTSGWAIPAVLSSTEFNSAYNKMDATNKELILKTSGGKELLHGQTGIAVGPYRKITHGIKLDGSGTKYVPDESTKYVLAYELGLYDGQAALNNGTATGTFTAKVSDIRSALESVDYHRHYVDVASDNVKITDNKVEITFSETIEDGREWELIIPPTAFRDNAENFYKGMNLDKLKAAEITKMNITTTQQTASDKYSLWSNNVAVPVVRVDRYSHGWGASEPNADGTLTKITVNNGKYKTTCAANSGARIAPTGYARSRIDCETPGASILYKTVNTGIAAYNAGTNVTANGTDFESKRSNIADATKAQLEFTTGGTAYTQGNNIITGDGTYTSARKDYISSYATKTGFAQSKNGMEGVFRTVVYVHTTNKRSNNYYSINIEGGTAKGGQPNVSGFPVRDATSENDPNGAGRYSKNAYNLSNSQTPGQDFVWVSYEIISSNWAILVCRSNHAKNYPYNSYGDVTYITKITDWHGTN